MIYKSHVSTWLFNSCPRNKIILGLFVMKWCMVHAQPIIIFVQSGGSQNLTYTFVIDQIFTIKLSKDPMFMHEIILLGKCECDKILCPLK